MQKRKFFIVISCIIIAIFFNLFALNIFAEDAIQPLVEDDTYYYFDLSLGNVIISDSSYSGYVYVDGIAVQKTYSNPTKQIYVYQSTGENTVWEGGLPQYNRLRLNSRYWKDYITNNTDIAAVVSNWNTAASNRTSTPYRIAVTGSGTHSLVVDNIWSSYITASTSRTTGGIGYQPSSGGKLYIRLKGDSRVGNIHYNSSRSDTQIIFENGDDETVPGSITCASFNGSDNHYNAVIGGNDNTGDHTYGMVFNGGVIYSGSRAADNCTAIGGGGNGHTNITINGGIITAVANTSGAAIGGGIGESSFGGNATITINGGTIYAYNFGYVSNMSGTKYFIPAAAIGGGSSCKSNGNDSTIINITGGTVYAQSLGGAGIGGGSSTMSTGGNAKITIGGNANVTAKSISGIASNGAEIHAGVSIGGGTAGYASKSNGGNVELTINGGSVKAGSIGGGACDNTTGKIGSATVIISNGTISGQVIMAKGAVTDCSFTMTGGTIDNSKFSDYDDFTFLQPYGGAVYVENGTATMTGGTIQNCNSINGGAVYVTGGNFILSGGKIQGCYATNGGAAYISNGDIEINGGTIYNCSASNNGGAIFVEGGNINMYNGIIDKNLASTNGGAIYAASNNLNVLINIYDGEIMNNTAGKHAGAIGANVKGSSTVTINIGKESCKGINKHEHTDNCCPILQNNTASISGGAICLHSETNQLAVNIYCGLITDNIAVRYEGTNSINQEGGILTVYGGEIEAGISVGLGTYTDLRPGADERQLIMRLWSNYEGGPSEPVLITCTLGVSLNLPANVYTWSGHELSGWTTIPNTQVGWNPVGGSFIVKETEDGYMDMYAVWDAQVSYIVYIPDSVMINDNSVGQMTISAELNYFKENSTLNIYIQSDFTLTEINSLDILNYEIRTSEPGVTSTLKPGDIAASYQYNNVADKILTFKLLSKPKYANIYSDIITFIIDYDEIIYED